MIFVSANVEFKIGLKFGFRKFHNFHRKLSKLWKVGQNEETQTICLQTFGFSGLEQVVHRLFGSSCRSRNKQWKCNLFQSVVT